jgi:hypothetical protein
MFEQYGVLSNFCGRYSKRPAIGPKRPGQLIAGAARLAAPLQTGAAGKYPGRSGAARWSGPLCFAAGTVLKDTGYCQTFADAL